MTAPAPHQPRPAPRAAQLRHLRRRHGLTGPQALLVAALAYGRRAME